MEYKSKKDYEAPSMELFEVRMEGVIALSDPRRELPFDDEGLDW